jgi:hypothetical protein
MKEAASENLEADVYHITEEQGELKAEAMKAEEEEDVLTVETEGFSYFTVEFTYQTLSYVLSGTERIALSSLMEELGLKGTPEAVSVSDEALLVLEDSEEGMTIGASQAFSSEEWLKVTIEGIDYLITITDDGTLDWASLQERINNAAPG